MKKRYSRNCAAVCWLFNLFIFIFYASRVCVALPIRRLYDAPVAHTARSFAQKAGPKVRHKMRDIQPGVCEAQMLRAAQRYAIPIGVLYAVAFTESGHKTRLDPYALNIDGHPIFPKSESEALSIVLRAKSQGAKYIDIGCMQVNERYHGHHFRSLTDMFRAELNVEYAASFLKRLYVKEGLWTKAIGRYHAGPGNLAEQRRYICEVIHNMVLSGFGNWTGESASFCGVQR